MDRFVGVARVAAAVRQGMGHTTKLGGYPHKAPIGYLNFREPIGARQVDHIVSDPERAPLVTVAFELYATGECTIERLAEEMVHRGLRNRGSDGQYPARAVTVSRMAHFLALRAHVGVVEWDGVEYEGGHEPIAARATFDNVEQLLASQAVSGTGEGRRHHALKGLLVCGVSGRRLSIQYSKGAYTSFCSPEPKEPAQLDGLSEALHPRRPPRSRGRGSLPPHRLAISRSR